MSKPSSERPALARLDDDLTERLGRMAKDETEGNMSQMVRKLVREALRQREANAQQIAS